MDRGSENSRTPLPRFTLGSIAKASYSPELRSHQEWVKEVQRCDWSVGRGGDIKSSQEGETNPLGLYVFELDKSEEPVDDCQVTVLHSPDPECKISHEVDPNNKSKTASVATRKVNLLEGDNVVFIGPSHRVSYPLGLVVEKACPECEQFAKACKHFQN
ncbi:hypothetical protein ACE6H2_016764 [Prunus campanulata]